MSESKSKSSVHPSRRELLKTAPAALAGIAAQTAAAAMPDRPNIVVIFSDQFRWDCIGANGLNPMGLTPRPRKTP